MKRMLIAAALAVLALPAAGQAKELTQATFCGAAGCRTIDHPRDLGGGDGVAEPTPAAGRYYTVRLTVEEGEGRSSTWRIFYIPDGDMIAYRDEHGGIMFERLYGAAALENQRLVQGLQPFPPPRVVRATVGGKPVADPASYLRLFAARSDGFPQLGDPDWQPIILTSTRPTPWTSGEYLSFSPSTGILEKGGEFVQLPDDLAASIRARDSLESADGGSGFDWPLVSTALIVAAAIGVAAFALVRRSRHLATA